MGIIGGGALVVLFLILAVAGVFSGSDSASAADLRAGVKANPKDAGGRMELGHALFRDGKRKAALDEYERALGLDKKAADAQLLTNLTASFGDKDRDNQQMAAVLIVNNKLVAIEDQLDDRANDDRHWVRWSAVNTLEKIDRKTKEDTINALRQDLLEDSCGLRKKAIKQLAKLDAGSKDEIAAATAKNKSCPKVDAAKEDEIDMDVDKDDSKPHGARPAVVSPI